jgi:hypothetical protein
LARARNDFRRDCAYPGKGNAPPRRRNNRHAPGCKVAVAPMHIICCDTPFGFGMSGRCSLPGNDAFAASTGLGLLRNVKCAHTSGALTSTRAVIALATANTAPIVINVLKPETNDSSIERRIACSASRPGLSGTAMAASLFD